MIFSKLKLRYTVAIRHEPVVQGNFFSQIPLDQSEEIIEELIQSKSCRLERIISTGQTTPQGEWYDQDAPEWVLLLTGGAGLLLENDSEMIIMKPGDYIYIPANCRHRVEWTDPAQPTIWLVLHYRN
jgi:cupin 2 domain-containing protein